MKEKIGDLNNISIINPIGFSCAKYEDHWSKNEGGVRVASRKTILVKQVLVTLTLDSKFISLRYSYRIVHISVLKNILSSTFHRLSLS